MNRRSHEKPRLLRLILTRRKEVAVIRLVEQVRPNRRQTPILAPGVSAHPLPLPSVSPHSAQGHGTRSQLTPAYTSRLNFDKDHTLHAVEACSLRQVTYCMWIFDRAPAHLTDPLSPHRFCPPDRRTCSHFQKGLGVLIHRLRKFARLSWLTQRTSGWPSS